MNAQEPTDARPRAPRMSLMEQDAVVGRSLRTPRAAGIAGGLFALLLTAALVLVFRVTAA